MANANLYPHKVLLFGPERGGLPGQGEISAFDGNFESIFLPNLSETLIGTCSRCKWDVSRVDEDSVNAPVINEQIQKLNPKLIIYSGYGAQLVGSHLLDLGIPFLHMHAGWPPDYRGSTTLYYSWLEENRCGVSAILLEKEIDKGPIVQRRRYPAPPYGIDPDHLYDGGIRADLLVSVLQDYSRDGALHHIQSQSKDGTVYYVIHPVLKLLRLFHKFSHIGHSFHILYLPLIKLIPFFIIFYRNFLFYLSLKHIQYFLNDRRKI